MLSLSVALALVHLSLVNAQVTGTFPATPLASKTFTWPNLPEKVDTDTGLIRGTQSGYNLCNSTTEGPNSLCQTSFANTIDDFCLWAPPTPNSTVADLEGEMVAWCSKPGHGTRIMPAGTLTGVQYLRTPNYVQIVGFMDQTLLDMAAGDFGGEMDPHGADLRGNPMGGLMFSNAFTNGTTIQQVFEWTNFIGGGGFCLKICDHSLPNDANYCQHIYDRIGCAYNAPNNAQPGVFEVCDGDNADFPGVYTSNGAVLTYTQPPESLGPITSMPYTARVGASSNCVTHSSAELFTANPQPTSTGATTTKGSTAAPTGGSISSSRSAAAVGPSTTSSSSGASTIAISGISVLGAVFASLFFS